MVYCEVVPDDRADRAVYLHVNLDDTGGSPLGSAPPLDGGRCSGRVLLRRLFHLCATRTAKKERERRNRTNDYTDPPILSTNNSCTVIYVMLRA